MKNKHFFRKAQTAALISLMLLSAAPQLKATELFPDDIFVTLRASGQIAKFGAPTLWQGAPVMLYNAITPDGKRVVVSSPKTTSIYVFDAATGKVLAQVKVGKDAKGLKISPDGKEVYVANEGAASISIVSLENYALLATIAVDEMPHNIRFSDDGKLAYVTLQGGAGLGVIDTARRDVLKVIPTPGLFGPHNIDLSKDGNTAFIRDTSNNVGVLELSSGKMKNIISVGQGHAGIDVSPNGRRVITGAIADDYVTVIDANSQEVVKKIKVGFGPHGVRASKDNRWIYVTVTSDDKLVVIDGQTLDVVTSLDAASFPFWLAVDGNP